MSIIKLLLLYTMKLWNGLLFSLMWLKWGYGFLLDKYEPTNFTCNWWLCFLHTWLIYSLQQRQQLNEIGNGLRSLNKKGVQKLSEFLSKLICCWLWWLGLLTVLCDAMQSSEVHLRMKQGWGIFAVILTLWDESAMQGLWKRNIKIILQRFGNHFNSEGHNIYMPS